jgi:hypothetical protein
MAAPANRRRLRVESGCRAAVGALRQPLSPVDRARLFADTASCSYLHCNSGAWPGCYWRQEGTESGRISFLCLRAFAHLHPIGFFVWLVRKVRRIGPTLLFTNASSSQSWTMRSSCSTKKGMYQAGIPARSESRATPGMKLLGGTFPNSTLQKI